MKHWSIRKLFILILAVFLSSKSIGIIQYEKLETPSFFFDVSVNEVLNGQLKLTPLVIGYTNRPIRAPVTIFYTNNNPYFCLHAKQSNACLNINLEPLVGVFKKPRNRSFISELKDSSIQEFATLTKNINYPTSFLLEVEKELWLIYMTPSFENFPEGNCFVTKVIVSGATQPTPHVLNFIKSLIETDDTTWSLRSALAASVKAVKGCCRRKKASLR